MMTDTDRTFQFTFLVHDGPLWEHRSLQEWLSDLLNVAGHPTTAVQAEGDADGRIRVKVVGTDAALRFSCAALNLHAEQTPWDGTPAEQATALEALLAAPDDRLPDNPHGQMRALELAVEVFRDSDFRSQMVGWTEAGLDSVVDRLNDVIGLAGDWVRDYDVAHDIPSRVSGLTPGGSCRG